MVLGNDTTTGLPQDHDISSKILQSQQHSHCFVTRSIVWNDAIESVCRLASRAANALLNPIVTASRERIFSCL
jgi:hypothetical protein